MKKSQKNIVYTTVLLMTILITIPAGADNNLLKVRKYRQAHEHQIIQEFVDLLSIPNVSSDKKNIRKNAEMIKKMMDRRSIKTQILETAGNPVVFGELSVPNAERTLMFYVHYDGQPVDPSHWTETHPFKPALRPGKLKTGSTEPAPIPFPGAGEKLSKDWRIYARGSSDDRAPIIGILTALDAFRSAGISLKNNLKFIFEGEEEAGSTNLGPFLEKHSNILGCDVLFMCDGPAYYSGDPTLFFGVRGITSLEITLYGPNVSVHSGHYGNWIPNPGVRLAHLIASMRDTNGKVKIKGFYDTVVPLTDFEIKALQTIPSYESDIKEIYGFSDAENNWRSLMEAIQFPALNINGLHSGWTGKQQRTIIPPTATVALDIRLAKGNAPAAMFKKVVEHVRSQGYFIVDSEPDAAMRNKYPYIAKTVSKEGGYRASRTPMDLPICQQVIKALLANNDKKPVLLPSLGGSLPIYLFSDLLQVPIIGVPIANHDNNQHQPDENIRIGHLWTGIETYAAILMMKK